MVYVGINTFLENPERYIQAANSGENVYICLNDGTEFKLQKCAK